MAQGITRPLPTPLSMLVFPQQGNPPTFEGLLPDVCTPDCAPRDRQGHRAIFSHTVNAGGLFWQSWQGWAGALEWPRISPEGLGREPSTPQTDGILPRRRRAPPPPSFGSFT